MHTGHRERMRTKYINNGIEAFEAHEVLEMLLFYSKARGNTNETAHLLLDRFSTVSNVFDASVEELCSVQGIGEQSAVLIKLTADLFNYYHRSKWDKHSCLKNMEMAGAYAADMVGERTVESLFLICLNAQRNVVSWNEIEKGVVAETNINPRKVVECAIRNNAHSVILVHNHPSGSLTPSQGDIDVTGLLCDAFEPLKIFVIDHIIVANRLYASMAKLGLLP